MSSDATKQLTQGVFLSTESRQSHAICPCRLRSYLKREIFAVFSRKVNEAKERGSKFLMAGAEAAVAFALAEETFA